MNQNRFRTGRSTLPPILTLRRLIEGIKEKQLPAILTFVDFSKAFDSIHRGKLMEILKAYGIPTKIVDAISILYKDTEAQMRNRPDGTYTRMLRAVVGVSWKEHKTNKKLYGNNPKITDTLMIRRLRFIERCWRKKDEVISELLLLEPKHGARKRGRPATTYVDQLRNDTGLSIAELKSIMGNRKEWMKLVNRVRVRSK